MRCLEKDPLKCRRFLDFTLSTPCCYVTNLVRISFFFFPCFLELGGVCSCTASGTHLVMLELMVSKPSDLMLFAPDQNPGNCMVVCFR